MGIEVVIGGREAIPVRAIPFITGGTISPDMVASALAKTDLAQRLESVPAYHLLPDGSVASMLPKEWDGIKADLQILSDKLKAKDQIDNESYPEWRRQSIPLLPPGVFVWKDEFEKRFAKVYSQFHMMLLDERPGDRDLNFSPFIPSELRGVVVEGFAIPEETGARASTEKPLTTTERNTLLTVC